MEVVAFVDVMTVSGAGAPVVEVAGCNGVALERPSLGSSDHDVRLDKEELGGGVVDAP